jgi:hypothetical protein
MIGADDSLHFSFDWLDGVSSRVRSVVSFEKFLELYRFYSDVPFNANVAGVSWPTR